MPNGTSAPQNSEEVLISGAVAYVIQGLIIGVPNLLVGLSILKYSALRNLNEYVLLMALSFADAVAVFGYVAAGLYRLLVVFTDNLGTLINPRLCLLVPHTIFWGIGDPLAALMLTIISADRLLLVAFPQFYLLSLPSPAYAYLLVGLGFFCTFAMSLSAVVAAFLRGPEAVEHIFCWMPDFTLGDNVFSSVYSFYCENAVPFFAFLSVPLYAAVLPVFRLRATAHNSAWTHNDAKNQTRMTKSLAISAVCTLCLYCIPVRIGYYIDGVTDFEELITRGLFLLSMCNPLANLAIYQLRHPEMRIALKGLLKRKSLSPNLKLWGQSNIHIQVASKSRSQVAPIPKSEKRNDLELQSVG